MAAIGRIRKHGVLLMIIIGVALLAFIVGDLTNVVNTGRNTVVKVGKERFETSQSKNIYGEYYQQNYEYLKIAYSNNPVLSENTTLLEQEAHRMTLDQIKHETMLDAQLAKLGLTFTKEMEAEISENVLKTAGSPDSPMGMIVNYALSEYTQQVDDYQTINNIYQQISQALQSAENMEQLNKESSLYRGYKAVERMYLLDAKENTYFGMAANSVHFSKKMLEQMSNDNQRFTGRMATININHPAFDNIKVSVSDDEAKAYFKEHKSRYMLRHDEKDLELAYFTVSATPDDMNEAAKLADELYQKMNEKGIKEFTSDIYKFDKIDLAYAPNSSDPYSYTSANASMVAAFAQVDTGLYLKADETAIQKRNALSISPNGYSSHAAPLTAELKAALHPTSMDSAVIAPRFYSNAIYFGQVRDIQSRPDSIKVARLMFPYTEAPKDNKEMTKEKAYETAMAIKAELDGKDSTAFIPYIKEYGGDTSGTFRPFVMLDGASFDRLGRYTYNPADTLTRNIFNALINTPVNTCHIQEIDNNNVYVLDMVIEKSEPVLKSQYVLYPVPVMATNSTIKSVQRNAAKAAACQSANDLAATAKKLGGEMVSTSATNMQGVVEVNGGLLDCREAIKWAYNTDKKAGNSVGSVASNPFRAALTNINQMNGETSKNEVFVVAGIKSHVVMQKPDFDDIKERVINDMKFEKKRDAVVARLKKEFNGKNMDEIAAKYGASAQAMNLGFSEYYGAMESAAVGKIANLTAGTTAVVSGVQSAYLVSVESVTKGADAKKEMMQQFTNQIKTIQQTDDKTAETQAKAFINSRFNEFAYRTVLMENVQAQQSGYPLAEVVKQLVYNNLEKDIPVIDHRHLFYGASDR